MNKFAFKPLVWVKHDYWVATSFVTKHQYAIFEEDGKFWVSLEEGMQDFLNLKDAKNAVQHDNDSIIMRGIE